MNYLKTNFLFLFILLSCTWFDTSQNKIKDQDILLYFLISENQNRLYFKYSCSDMGKYCRNEFNRISNDNEIDNPCSGWEYSKTHCPKENFKKMCIIKTPYYVHECILYDLNEEGKWRQNCETIASLSNAILEYKDIYEIKYFY